MQSKARDLNWEFLYSTEERMPTIEPMFRDMVHYLNYAIGMYSNMWPSVVSDSRSSELEPDATNAQNFARHVDIPV